MRHYDNKIPGDISRAVVLYTCGASVVIKSTVFERISNSIKFI